jgi:hypothetical protein
MREAINGGIDLPFDQQLKDELVGVEYQFTNKNQVQLERKEQMKDRIGSSPDRADALSMLYSQPIKLVSRAPKIILPTGTYGWMS